MILTHRFIFLVPPPPLAGFRSACGMELDRIIEIEWAVKNNAELVLSPMKEKTKTSKSRKKMVKRSRLRASTEQSYAASGASMDMDMDEWRDEEREQERAQEQDQDRDERDREKRKERKGKAVFGIEMTNSPTKRPLVEREMQSDDERVEQDTEENGTPLKKQRRSGKRIGNAVLYDESDDEKVTSGPIKGHRKLGVRRVAALR
jgi:hypothetical protein